MSSEHAQPGRDGGNASAAQPTEPGSAQAATAPKQKPTYWLTRFVILRWLGLVYFFAFYSAAKQIVPLIGSHGLLPAEHFMKLVKAQSGGTLNAFLELPSVFWFGVCDSMLSITSWIGVCLSLVVLAGYANSILMFVLWALYMSIVHIGQDWYGYGWEILLLESGFLAIFLCPLLDGRPFPRRAPPVLVIWVYRWLIFRIMIGAGLIKLRGDWCWRDLTCLYYHYETQPIPNPLSWWLHFRPHWFHQFGCLWNHIVELIIPWFAFGTRPYRHIAGVLLVSFQFFLIFSGNLSFLNWLTIVPALACFDDSFWGKILPKGFANSARVAEELSCPCTWGNRCCVGLTILIVLLSIAPITNMLSAHQVMNTSFTRLHLVNTYGAFGSVGRERYEIVFEGTSDATITPTTRWREYEFIAKPGDPKRRPPIIAPYQPRIDWQIWFAAMSSPDNYPWTLHFVWKLLHNDSGTLSLLANNPFPDRAPHYIRAQYYLYQFAPPGSPSGVWWNRKLVGSWLPPLSADDPNLKQFLKGYGWQTE